MQLVLREVFQILRHLWVVCRLSQNALEESVNHLGVLHSLSWLKYARDEENVKECFSCYSEFYKSTWIQNGLFTSLIHVPGRYYGVQRLTTPKALSPKSLSFSFKHTATGVFLRDSLHKKEAKCHNAVNCCLKLINLNHLTISVDFSSKTYLFNTISIGTPGFTIAIFIHSLPKSTDITATDSTTQKKYQRAEIPHSRIKKRNL